MTANLRPLLASSVVRGIQLGESHGGLNLIDVEAGRFELKLNRREHARSWPNNVSGYDVGV